MPLSLFGLLCLAILGQAPAAPKSDDVPQWQTAAGGKQSFEVASIKKSPDQFVPPSFPLDNSDAFRPTGSRFHADFPVTVLLQFAYKVRFTREQVQAMRAHLPKWVFDDRFTIEGKATGAPTKDQFRLMIQSLLAERFKAAFHFETQEVPLFELTQLKPGKFGPKLRLHSDGPPCDPAPPVGSPANPAGAYPPYCDAYMMLLREEKAHLGSRNTTMDLLAEDMSNTGRLGRPVVDKTGIKERIDFELEFVPERPPTATAAADTTPDPQGPTFLQALREQLGLKLEPAKGPIKVLVIDHIELPTEN